MFFKKRKFKTKKYIVARVMSSTFYNKKVFPFLKMHSSALKTHALRAQKRKDVLKLLKMKWVIPEYESPGIIIPTYLEKPEIYFKKYEYNDGKIKVDDKWIYLLDVFQIVSYSFDEEIEVVS